MVTRLHLIEAVTTLILDKNGCNNGCKHFVKITIRGKTEHRCGRGINIGLFRKYNCLAYDKDTTIKNIKNIGEKLARDRFVL